MTDQPEQQLSTGAQDVLERVRQDAKTQTLPQTMADVLRAIDDPDASAGEIGRIILRDAPLTVKVLRLANSAVYGRSQQVSTVSQAIVLLGVRAVKSLVLSTSVYQCFQSTEIDGLDLRRFWHHSLESGTLAQKLAQECGYAPHEEAFVAALVHDVGVLMLCRAIGTEYIRVFDDVASGLSLADREQTAFGIDHARAAAIILGEWGFPKHLTRAIARHHEPLAGGEFGDIDRLPVLVSLADAMSHSTIDRAVPVTRAFVENKRICAERLGFDSRALSTVDRWVGANLGEMARYLDVDLGSPVELLSEANGKLYELIQELEHLVIQTTASSTEENLTRDEMVAMCALETICATFSHFINNATTTIMGRSELIDLAVGKGVISDVDDQLRRSMKTIQNAVTNITAVLEELKNLKSFDIVPYHERVMILNIDEAVRDRLEQMRG